MTDKKTEPPPKKLSFMEAVREGWLPYRQLLPYLKPYRTRFFSGIGCGLLSSLVNALLLLVMRRVTDEVFPGGSTPHTGNLMKGVSNTGDLHAILWVCALIPAIMILRVTLGYLQAYCMAWVSLKVLNDIQKKLFNHLVRQSLDFFNRSQSGALISCVANETRMAQMVLTTVTTDIVQQPFTILAALGVLLYLDWKFTFVSLCLFPLCLVPIITYGKKARRNARAQQESQSGSTVILSEAFAGIHLIKAFSREQYESERFARINQEMLGQSMRVRRSVEIVGPMIEGISAIGAGLALVYVWSRGMSTGTFLALIYGTTQLYNPAKILSRIHVNVQTCLAATTHIFELLNTEPSVQDAPAAPRLERGRGEILFDKVTFSYSTAREKAAALQEVDLHIPAGTSCALVGQSGAGKSTILSLLLRLYDPDAGRIMIDGSDIGKVTQESLRENIGIVTQDTFLFHDTIYNNIIYGRLDATREEVIQAAQLAYAHDFILAQPRGYDTVIGDKGSLLSGGQQQRLSIARALLKNAPILLLDEATSALDTESEQQIQMALERLSAGRTVIAIAHRLSTILKSDRIVVMQQGRIVDSGTHADLYEKSMHYRQLYDIQFKGRDEQPPAIPGVATADALE